MEILIADPNIEFLRKCFRTYYKTTPIQPPDRFTRREWGFFLFGARNMVRHTRFDTSKELLTFLGNRVPQHAYCSSAYYKDPALTPMPDKFKGWMGADLIFDLDADHLKNAESMTYEEQLENVKKMVRKLLFEFLIPDFGFSEKYTHLFFSGGRGYHIHITDPKVLTLKSKDRQEIVDYLSGTGIDTKKMITEEVVGSTGFQQFTKASLAKRMHEADAPGWKGRMRRGMNDLLERMKRMSEDQIIDYIENLKKEDDTLKGYIGEKKTKQFYQQLFAKNPDGTTAVDSIINTGNLDRFSGVDADINILVKIIIAETKVNLAGETDEPVTKDVKRLLRMPHSLHGKTGFKVTPVPLEDIHSFNPLNEAVVFSDLPVKLEITRPSEIRLKGENFKLDVGETEVPLYTAVFLVGRRSAKVL